MIEIIIAELVHNNNIHDWVIKIINGCYNTETKIVSGEFQTM